MTGSLTGALFRRHPLSTMFTIVGALVFALPLWNAHVENGLLSHAGSWGREETGKWFKALSWGGVVLGRRCLGAQLALPLLPLQPALTCLPCATYLPRATYLPTLPTPHCAIPCSEKTPVTIVTGFLGSGKTTLINYILTENHGKRIAIIENEFGAIDIDSSLISSNAKLTAKEDVISMDNGCVCCTVRGDLVNAFKSLSARAEKYDAVMIETTGMADPAPVAFTFNTQPEVGARFKIDAILCVVDCKHIQQHLDDVVALSFFSLLCSLSYAELPPHPRARESEERQWVSVFECLNVISITITVAGRGEAHA